MLRVGCYSRLKTCVNLFHEWKVVAFVKFPASRSEQNAYWSFCNVVSKRKKKFTPLWFYCQFASVTSTEVFLSPANVAGYLPQKNIRHSRGRLRCLSAAAQMLVCHCKSSATISSPWPAPGRAALSFLWFGSSPQLNHCEPGALLPAQPRGTVSRVDFNPLSALSTGRSVQWEEDAAWRRGQTAETTRSRDETRKMTQDDDTA